MDAHARQRQAHGDKTPGRAIQQQAEIGAVPAFLKQPSLDRGRHTEPSPSPLISSGKPNTACGP